MDYSIITVRYAKAFFLLAKEKNLLEVFKTDMETISGIVEGSSDFILLLESPVVKTSKKVKLISQIFSGSVHELTLKFLTLITINKRETHIPGICRNFLDLTRREMGIKTAMMTTATGMDEATLGKAKQIIEKEFDSKIELAQKINPEIIGGLVIRIEDKQIDASVLSQLKKIKTKFLEPETK